MCNILKNAKHFNEMFSVEQTRQVKHRIENTTEKMKSQ